MKDGVTMTIGQLFSGVNGLVSAIVNSGYTDWNQSGTAYEIYPNISAVNQMDLGT